MGAGEALFGSVLSMIGPVHVHVHVIFVQKNLSLNPALTAFSVFGSTNTIPGFPKFEIFCFFKILKRFKKIQEFTKDR